MINAFVWGGFTWIGCHLTEATALRMGYGNFGQDVYYIVFPLAMVSISLVPAGFLNGTKLSALGQVWSCVTLIPLFPYLLYWTGGM
jgi:hypothetical protein